MTTTAQHAIKALLWCSTVEQDGETVEADNFEASPELIARISKEWQQFSDESIEIGFDAELHRELMINRAEGDEWAHCAHDWILTRQGTGSGLNDPGKWLKPWGEKLTRLAIYELCYVEGLKDEELYLYIDDNNQISAEA